jgi:hypothetical protein
MEPVSTTSATSAASALGYGLALKRARKVAGLTQAELAEAAGFSVVYIGMLKRGARQPQRYCHPPRAGARSCWWRPGGPGGRSPVAQRTTLRQMARHSGRRDNPFAGRRVSGRAADRPVGGA